MTKKYSSFENQQLYAEAWRQYVESGEIDEGIMDRLKGAADKLKKLNPLKNPYSAARRRDGTVPYADTTGMVDTPTGEMLPGDDPTAPAAEPAAPAAQASAAADSDIGMPISGTEFATMNFLAGGKLLDIIKRAVNVGAAAKDPDSRNLQQLFNKEFFPALVKMTKNPNIDIAEGIDMEQFLQEMLTEAYGAADAGGPLTKRQQAAKKGQARARGGMQRYLRSAGGKPPVIANKISRDLTKALTQSADAASLEKALAHVLGTIKDPKEKAQYEKRYKGLLTKSPDKRVVNYKQNVAAFVGAVSDLATKAAAKALASGADFAGDKAARTAAARAPAPAAEPEQGAPQRRSSSVSRMRSRDRSAASGVFKGVTEGKKGWIISEDGSVTRVGNEKK